MFKTIATWLNEPRLAGLKVGSRDFFRVQGELIAQRRLLSYCYDQWYRALLDDPVVMDAPTGAILLELGSGGSQLKQYDGRIITSDVCADVADRVIDACELPFSDHSVTAIFMTHVFHHVPDVRRFLREADRVLVPGGVVSMIEVAGTPLARFFFSHFHPEPFRRNATHWAFTQADSMMDSNQALSWIVFRRDYAAFRREFPTLNLEVTSYLPWLSYLLSGGVTKRQLVPAWAAPAVIWLDRITRALWPLTALHWHIKLRKARHEGPP